MADAKINETCIIGLPRCGYAFSGNRMAFIAAPSDVEFQLELDILKKLLEEKEYEAQIALREAEPAKFAFCSKICSKIITSQFCIVLLNSSKHENHPEVYIPNPNVHLEYGIMLAFKKYTIPFKKEGGSLAFNIQPLDTIIYNQGNFSEKAEKAIDSAILANSSISLKSTTPIFSSELLIRYLSIRRLKFSDINTSPGKDFYNLGNFLGYSLLDGKDIVYFGMFDVLPAKEVVFRLKLLLQNLHETKKNFEENNSKNLTPDQIEYVYSLWSRLNIEILISDDVDKSKVSTRVNELVIDFETVPWKLLKKDDIQTFIDNEYGEIGEI